MAERCYCSLYCRATIARLWLDIRRPPVGPVPKAAAVKQTNGQRKNFYNIDTRRSVTVRYLRDSEVFLHVEIFLQTMRATNSAEVAN